MTFLLALAAFSVGYLVRSVIADAEKVRRDFEDMFGPVPEPHSNVVPVDFQRDGQGFIA